MENSYWDFPGGRLCPFWKVDPKASPSMLAITIFAASLSFAGTNLTVTL
jgi:hypothetical protein